MPKYTAQTSAVSTHSRPKAADEDTEIIWLAFGFQHTAARRRLSLSLMRASTFCLFQHTAARRRLVGASGCDYRR